MCPILTLTLGNTSISVEAYALFASLAALSVLTLGSAFLRRGGLAAGESVVLALVLLAAFLVGARLLNCLINPGLYAGGMHVYSLRMAGFSLYGGLLLSAVALFVWANVRKHPFWKLADSMVTPCCAAFVLCRIGCFLNGCCGGKATSSIFGVVFSSAAGRQKALSVLFPFLPATFKVHPTQLYEAVAALLGLLVVWLFRVLWRKSRAGAGHPPVRRNMLGGCAFLLYGLWLTACRFALLPLRALPYSDFVIKTVYPVLYAALLLSGAAVLAVCLKRAYDFSKHGAQTPNNPEDR